MGVGWGSIVGCRTSCSFMVSFVTFASVRESAFMKLVASCVSVRVAIRKLFKLASRWGDCNSTSRLEKEFIQGTLAS